jgi:AraC-like DNA-binding protein
VPRIHITRTVATCDVSAIRARCDGCDPARPCDEHARGAALWMVTAGAFELRDAAGRHVLDPTRAIVMPAGHAFRIRHPAGPDVCLAFGGPIVDALAARGARLVAVAPAHIAQITTALAGDDDLALAEALAQLAPPDPADPAEPAGPDDPRPRAAAARDSRDLSAAVIDALRTRYADPTSLGELAAITGYSVFHTCRVFRATTGTTIHGFRRELRLRHALARILDGREPLTEIAAATGFASQSHLTNLFRARFGITPARARTHDGARALR